jgi:hypothetical protein
MAVKFNQCNTGFPIIIYRGISLSLAFTYKDDDDNPIDLTGKEIVFKLKFDNTILTYNSTPNSFGSVVTITDDINGEFHVLVTDEETTDMDLQTEGRWWLELHDGGNVDLLYKDNVTVQDV